MKKQRILIIVICTISFLCLNCNNNDEKNDDLFEESNPDYLAKEKIYSKIVEPLNEALLELFGDSVKFE